MRIKALFFIKLFVLLFTSVKLLSQEIVDFKVVERSVAYNSYEYALNNLRDYKKFDKDVIFEDSEYVVAFAYHHV